MNEKPNLSLPATPLKTSPQLTRLKIQQPLPNVATGSGGSATGNPRNKTALKPGHSLMDWIRLGSSGVDLTGIGGRVMPVSHAELSKHNSREDAWMAIRGKVYNVTRYMEFHPGGPDELMRGIGTDATKLFEEYHAWVNYEQLMSKCFIGPLKNMATLNLNTAGLSPPKPNKVSPNLSQSSDSIPTMETTTKSLLSSGPKLTPVEIVPRFDWMQKTSTLNLIFYTKSLCNPCLIVKQTSDNEIDVQIFLVNNSVFEYMFSLSKDVQWPCQTKITQETGKIEIIFNKKDATLWTNFGTYERKKITEFEIYEFDYELCDRTAINHDSYGVVLRPKSKILQIVPLGFHFSITGKIFGNEVTRSYTPIPLKYAPMELNSTQILFFIKYYNLGVLSKQLTQQPIPQTVRLSHPKGNFDLKKLREHTKFGILSAGSGITPMLPIIDYLLERSNNRVEFIKLLNFNKTETDVWIQEKLATIAKNDERFSMAHILSEPDDKWKGERGKISTGIIEKLLKESVTYICICGPSAFNDISRQLLKDKEFDLKNLHVFQG